jgi:hypothetical protein
MFTESILGRDIHAASVRIFLSIQAPLSQKKSLKNLFFFVQILARKHSTEYRNNLDCTG